MRIGEIERQAQKLKKGEIAVIDGKTIIGTKSGWQRLETLEEAVFGVGFFGMGGIASELDMTHEEAKELITEFRKLGLGDVVSF